MKQTTARNSFVRWTGILGMMALFAGTLSALPAHADDYGRTQRDRDHIRHDVAELRRDEDHLHDLYRRRDYLADRHDWRAVHRVEDEIARVRERIDRKRQDAHEDFQRLRRDRDHEGYYEDGNRYRNGINTGYRNGQPEYGRYEYRGDYRVH